MVGTTTRTEKPTLEYAIICDDVRQEVGEKISLMGLFDNVAAQSFPAFHPRLAVVAAYSGPPGDYKSEVLLTEPNGTTLQLMGAANLKLTALGKSARHISVALNLQFKTEGVYQIKILLNGNLYRSVPLNVQKIGKPQ